MPKKLFVKGVTLNPNGRPKGSMNKSTISLAQLRNAAAGKYEEYFRILWDCVLAREPWAIKHFGDQFMPKNICLPTIDIDHTQIKDIDSHITAIKDGLSQYGVRTHDEALAELKAISNVKVNEAIERITEVTPLTPQEKAAQIEQMAKLIQYEEEVKKDEES